MHCFFPALFCFALRALLFFCIALALLLHFIFALQLLCCYVVAAFCFCCSALLFFAFGFEVPRLLGTNLAHFVWNVTPFTAESPVHASGRIDVFLKKEINLSAIFRERFVTELYLQDLREQKALNGELVSVKAFHELLRAAETDQSNVLLLRKQRTTTHYELRAFNMFIRLIVRFRHLL